jgi:hypothetical protein
MRSSVAARAGETSGQAAPVLAGLLALFVVALLALGALAGAAGDAARARTAADAAALAAVSGGRSAAEALATANGARLVSYRTVTGGSIPAPGVVVVVAVGDAHAAARAELAPVSPP